MKSLQSDNIKLYEKVRYMQSYRDEVAAGPSTSTLNPISRNRAEGAGRTDDLSKYRARYEDAMNPFEAFRGRVSLVVTCFRSVLNDPSCRKSPELCKPSIPLNEVSWHSHALFLAIEERGLPLSSMLLHCIFWLFSRPTKARWRQIRSYNANRPHMDDLL